MEAEKLLAKLDEKFQALENHYGESFDRESVLKFMVEHKIKSPSEAFAEMNPDLQIETEEWLEERPHFTRDNLDNEVRKVLFGAGHDDSRPSDPVKLEEKDAPNKGRKSSSEMEDELAKKMTECFEHPEEEK